MTLYNRLLEVKDDDYKVFQAKLVPTVPPETIVGVRTPDMRKIAKELYGRQDRDAFLPYVDCWPVSDQATPKTFKKHHQ